RIRAGGRMDALAWDHLRELLDACPAYAFKECSNGKCSQGTRSPHDLMLDLSLNTRDFSLPPAQPALYQRRNTDCPQARVHRRTIRGWSFRLFSQVSAEGHTQCTRSTLTHLSAQLAPALPQPE